jgi:hypothetical protein
MKTITTRIIGNIRNLVDAIKKAFAPLNAKPVQPFGPASMPYTNAVFQNLCGNDPERTLEVMWMLARPLRNNGVKLPQALWFRGGHGTGKSLFFANLIMPMYGTSAALLPIEVFKGSFNGWAAQTRLAVVDEFDCSRDSMMRLKHMITADSFRIERKNHTATIIRNQLNFILMSGDKEALPLHADERRFMILESGPALPPEYYAGMAEEIRQGGALTYQRFLLEQLPMEGLHTQDSPAKPYAASRSAEHTASALRA